MACAYAAAVGKEEVYEKLIDRSGHRHRVSGDIFRLNNATNLVNPAAGRKPQQIEGQVPDDFFEIVGSCPLSFFRRQQRPHANTTVVKSLSESSAWALTRIWRGLQPTVCSR
jgi:hypothetical protein